MHQFLSTLVNMAQSIQSQLGNQVILVRILNLLNFFIGRNLLAVLHMEVELLLQLHDFIELFLIEDKLVLIHEFDYFLLLVN